MKSSVATDPGLVRTINGDTIISREPAAPLESIQKGTIWLIADGLGSNEQSVRASNTAAESLVSTYWELAIPDVAVRLQTAVEQTNDLLFAENPPDTTPQNLFGATILAGVIVDRKLYVAHVGRSRAYLLRNGELRQLTEDHTWVAMKIRTGELTPEEAQTHPRRNVITRCLGVRQSVEVDVIAEQLEPGDALLFTSDGLSRHLDDDTIAEFLITHGSSAAQPLVDEALRLGGKDNVTTVAISVERSAAKDVPALERIALLTRFSYELTQTLDIDGTLQMALKQMLALSGAQRAAIMLKERDGSLAIRVAYDVWGGDRIDDPSHSVAEQALRELRSVYVNDALDDPRFSSSESIVAMSLRSILCVPLIVQDNAIGVLYVDSSAGSVFFSQSDLDLLVSFASQAAAAIQNAHLHNELLARTRQVELASRRQNALFRSLSSALIAIDDEGVVTDWNPAAEQILEVSAKVAIGSQFSTLVPKTIVTWMRHLIAQVESRNQTIISGNEWEGEIGSRTRAILAGRVARIRDHAIEQSGFVFIINDRTDHVMLEEARRAESHERQRIHGVFRRYLAPPVVEKLLGSPESVQLGGTRHDVSVLFADVRGYTWFSERHSPEEVLAVLNSYLELATNAIFDQLGIVDKFLGDGVMAIFGAPIETSNHELAAIRAAMSMRAQLDDLVRNTGVEVGFGIGVNSGEAIIGNIGAPQLMSYTAIGDVVNVAARLESEARTGEVLISDDTLRRVVDHVTVEELGSIYVKHRLEPVRTYKVLDILDAAD